VRGCRNHRHAFLGRRRLHRHQGRQARPRWRKRPSAPHHRHQGAALPDGARPWRRGDRLGDVGRRE